MAEDKYIINYQQGLGTPSAAGVFNLLNGVALGTDYTNRIGRRITMDSLRFYLSCEPNTAGTSPTGDLLRIIIFLDKQANGSTPTTTQLLDAADYTEAYNENNQDRFCIYLDKTVNLEACEYTGGTLTAGDPKFHSFTEEIELDEKATYSGTGSTAADIATGSLWFFCISAYASWKATFNSKVLFTDN